MPIYLGNQIIQADNVFLGSAQTSEIRNNYIAEYQLGQFREGGYVYYIAGTYPNQYGLIASPSENQFDGLGGLTNNWGCNGTLLGASGSALGTGRNNTNTILANCPTRPIAASYCDELWTYNGYNDWFLPSVDEVSELYTNRTYVPGLGTSAGYYYVSSTETDSTQYKRVKFFTPSAGTVDNGDKGTFTNMVFRPVRYFGNVWS